MTIAVTTYPYPMTTLSQDDLMETDKCIQVDKNDKYIGHCSKKAAHTFSKKSPRGKLHRAFSVFLFDSNGKLLLQQRAADKITFPSVWTNTCCSHPLWGVKPTEFDDEKNSMVGKVDGIKRAAIRKLAQELGINSNNFNLNDFKYLTRLHYWAADVVTHGKNSPWGEHEIDYILLIQKNVTIQPNPEEVADTKYVTHAELQEMMEPKSGLLWSPWFRIIVKNFLPVWWNQLKVTLETDKYVDYKVIHRFDPSAEHMGGAGNAGAFLGNLEAPFQLNESSASSITEEASPATTEPVPLIGNQALKQGSYGKVLIHEHSTLNQLLRIDEIFSAIWFKFFHKMDNKVDLSNENVRFCDSMLEKVSRSFAAVIRQLPKELCLDILVFYLALRALDTIEDDMEAFKGREGEKIHHLNHFYETGLVTEGWFMNDVGKGDEKYLLEHFNKCVAVFHSLPKSSQEIIADITKRMGQGMAKFIGRELGQGTETTQDYNEYCHYVAGLVGEGLSRLFTSTYYESMKLEEVSKTLANTMGLLLQKTNIIRDYLEDYMDGRSFWPQEVWKQYALTDDLGEFIHENARERSLHCLNHLITDALDCVPDCLSYMDLIKTEEIFSFCAIPQAMAIATLAELYNNPKVFTGVVKIRKGQAVQIMMDSTTVEGLHKWFHMMTKQILNRIPKSDPNAELTRKKCIEILKLTEKKTSHVFYVQYRRLVTMIGVITLCISTAYLFLPTEFPQFGDGKLIVQLPYFESDVDQVVGMLLVISLLNVLYNILFPLTLPKLMKSC